MLGMNQRALEKCVRALETARRERDEAIRRAAKDGMTTRAISEATGLSHQRTGQQHDRSKPCDQDRLQQNRSVIVNRCHLAPAISPPSILHNGRKKPLPGKNSEQR